MKIIFVLIYTFNSNTLLWGEDWSTIYHSVSHEELLRSDQDQQSQVKIKERCLYEREKRLFPRYCFLYMESLLTDPLAFHEIKNLKNEVNSLCIIRSEGVLNEFELKEVLKHPLLSLDCRKKLNVRLADIRYARGLIE